MIVRLTALSRFVRSRPIAPDRERLNAQRLQLVCRKETMPPLPLGTTCALLAFGAAFPDRCVVPMIPPILMKVRTPVVV